MVLVSKLQFKARAMELFRLVESSGESVIVTDHGKPTILVRRYSAATRSQLDRLKGSVVEYVDPMEPVSTDDWDPS